MVIVLQVTIGYEGEPSIFETLRSLQFTYDQGSYLLKGADFTATITHDPINMTLVLLFSKKLSFQQYKQIHKIIATIAEKIDAHVDDQLALIGYLENGKEAYIFHDWTEWLLFLEGAKLISMETQKVKIFENQQLLAEGILLGALTDATAKDDFCILQCTIITRSGEKIITGKSLKIIPTGEF
jgi:hypothetical protein